MTYIIFFEKSYLKRECCHLIIKLNKINRKAWLNTYVGTKADQQ